MSKGSRTGGRIVVDQLVAQGVDTIFCVPGESYLEILDALHDVPGIRLVNARHEAGAANMADAYGKLTGRPGICMVTRGPGASHAAVGIHTAHQDSTPLIMIVGQVPRTMRDREAFQEIDYRAMFGGVAKWVAEIDLAERIPEYLSRAFHVATSGRPGPVVLSVPEDMLRSHAAVADAPRAKPVATGVSPASLAQLKAMLATAERPLILAGGSGWTDAACRSLATIAERHRLPVATSFRRQDIFDNRSDCYVGDFGTSGPPALVERIGRADLLLVIGARLGEMTTQGYTTLSAPAPAQTLVHVHPASEELGRVYGPELAINCSSEAFCSALEDLRWDGAEQAAEWTRQARADYLADTQPPATGEAVDLGAAMAALRDELPPDSIVTLDAGNHTGWPQRFLRYGRPGRQVASTSGAMGYSVPAAVAASLVFPERVVVGFVGDGGFMMSGQEITTAVQFGGKPIVIVVNNESYGTIRMHQERRFPQRVVGTDLSNPDFAALGAALGAYAERVDTTEQFLPAFRRAVASGRPAVIEVRMSVEQISTRATVSQLRNRE